MAEFDNGVKHGTGLSRRQVLALAGSAAALGLASRLRPLHAAAPATGPAATAPAPVSNRRFKIAGDDMFINGQNARGNPKTLTQAKQCGLDGIAVDMGRMPNGGSELVNPLAKPEVRQQFLDDSKKLGIQICSLSWFAMYAHVFPNFPNAVDLLHDWVDTMAKMSVPRGHMILMTKDGTLREPEHAAVWKKSVDIFKEVAPAAEKAGVIMGVESNLDGDGYKRFLDAVGSKNVQAVYNPGVGLGDGKFDVYKDIKDLGNDRVCMLHLEQGSVPPETIEHRLGDGLIDFKKLHATLLEMNWSGWMTIARSRLKGTESKFTQNMTANAKFLHDMFTETV